MLQQFFECFSIGTSFGKILKFSRVVLVVLAINKIQQRKELNTKKKTLMDEVDIVDVLREEHRMVEEFYNNYVSTKDTEERKKWFNQFLWALCVHSVAEEAIVYSVLESIGEKGKELGQKSREDHEELKLLLADLSTAKDEAEFDKKFELAFKTLMEHVQLEEAEDLPFLKDHVALKQRQNIAQMFLMKKYLIPVRPHPWIPEKKAALELALGLLISPIDKVKNMFLTQNFPVF